MYAAQRTNSNKLTIGLKQLLEAPVDKCNWDDSIQYADVYAYNGILNTVGSVLLITLIS